MQLSGYQHVGRAACLEARFRYTEAYRPPAQDRVTFRKGLSQHYYVITGNPFTSQVHCLARMSVHELFSMTSLWKGVNSYKKKS